MAKAGVRWFAPRSGSAARDVELAPGATQRFELSLADYFEVPLRPVDVWASVALPGLHRVPKLGGGGAGVNPVP